MRILRFKDLKAAGIFNDRMGVRRAILRGDLEPGLEMAPNTLGWTDEMIEHYVQSRPRRMPGSKKFPAAASQHPQARRSAVSAKDGEAQKAARKLEAAAREAVAP
jgi:hypothetical protein